MKWTPLLVVGLVAISVIGTLDVEAFATKCKVSYRTEAGEATSPQIEPAKGRVDCAVELPISEPEPRTLPPVLTAGPGGEAGNVLIWTAPVNDAPTLAYNIYRGECPTCTTLLDSIPPLPGDRFATYVDAATEPDRTYFYQVAQVRADGEAPPSHQVRVGPVPEPTSTPPVLAALADAETITLAWAFNAAAHAQPVTGFNIYRGTCSGCTTLFDWVPAMPGASSGTYTDHIIDRTELYFYQVAPTFGSIVGEKSNEVIAVTSGRAEVAMIHWQSGEGWTYLYTPGLSCISSDVPITTSGYGKLECIILNRLPTGYHCVNPAVSAALTGRTVAHVYGVIDCGSLSGSCLAVTGGTPCLRSVWGTSDGQLTCKASVGDADPTKLATVKTTCSNDP